MFFACLWADNNLLWILYVSVSLDKNYIKILSSAWASWIFSVISCDQIALWMVFSVRLSGCPSVTPFSLCSHHHIIMKFPGVITNDKSEVHANSWGQRLKVKVAEVKIQLNSFRTVIQVWIPYDEEMMHKAWCCLEKVPYCFSRSSVKFQGHSAK